MDRTAWLRQVRRETEEEYTRLAPLYGEEYGLHISATHRQFVGAFLDLFLQGSLILDAACGAGKYLPNLLERGHTITGIDQSQGMLARARENYPEVQLKKVGLQEMAYQEVFHGAICMDAMEHVCPEDWPLALSNFYQALKQQGYLYFTVEMADEKDVQQAFDRAQQAGLPVVYGEWPDESVYHYYPARRQVKEWIRQAGFELFKEGDGDGYYHLIVRKARLGKAARSSEMADSA